MSMVVPGVPDIIGSNGAIDNNNSGTIDNNNSGTDTNGNGNNGIHNSILGAWILDKSRGQPSMRGYLETMGVNDLAIEAHEKGDAEHDTVHTMSIGPSLQPHVPPVFCIFKQSRVNNLQVTVPMDQQWHDTDLGVMSKGGTAYVSPKALPVGPPPERRIKSTRVVMEASDRIRIESKLPTMNGIARVVDLKTLISNDVDINGRALPAVMKQELTVWNEKSKQSHTTVRYFVPHTNVAPHQPPPTARGQPVNPPLLSLQQPEMQQPYPQAQPQQQGHQVQPPLPVASQHQHHNRASAAHRPMEVG
jgi:hypothetical protein